ncbi:MAG: dihydroxyacetone kinase subunit [Proteobacteria bacterium]|nr:dihydroxyacetone kinase subunit [Pseudomonadota bacterium]
METISKDQVMHTVAAMCDIIIKNEVPFCELDSVAGDGDFGMSLAKGFKQIQAQWAELETDDIGAFLKSCGMVITEHCGGASGPIWGSAFRGMGKSAQDKATLNLIELGEMLQAAVDAIQKRGGAKLGDKTLLDALIPLVESIKLSAAAQSALLPAFQEAAKAAVEGAEKTKLITATKGRASYVGERSINFPDAGATAIGVIATELLMQ